MEDINYWVSRVTGKDRKAKVIWKGDTSAKVKFSDRDGYVIIDVYGIPVFIFSNGHEKDIEEMFDFMERMKYKGKLPLHYAVRQIMQWSSPI